MMEMSTMGDRNHQQAERRLQVFQGQFEDEAYGKQMLDLASHAAFPLTLTTDLMYCLRENFFPDCPWIASPDILLSGLCNSVGYDLYEMAAATKIILLKRLLDNFGEGRLEALESFMGDYIQHHLALQPKSDRILNVGEPGTPLKWTALALLKPRQLYDQIRHDLQTLLQGRNSKEYLRLASLVETYADLLPMDVLAEYRPLFIDLAEQVLEKQVPEKQVPDGQRSDRIFHKAVETVTLNQHGQEIDRRSHKVPYYREGLAKDGSSLNMVAIPGNEFWMGTDKDAPEYRNNKETPKHKVIISPFWMSQYPITEAQWRVVSTFPKVNRDLRTDHLSPSKDDHPINNVFWGEMVEFCDRLSQKTGRSYRLPSEAEWEYACRAGTETAYHFGPTITQEYANYESNDTTPVGDYGVANDFGLYDMHGNVWEWCQDDWHNNYEGAPSDGRAWLAEPLQENAPVRRGGSWNYPPHSCRSASRDCNFIEPNTSGGRFNFIGFRIVVSAVPYGYGQSPRSTGSKRS